MKILSAVVAIIFFAIGAMAETTNDLSDAEIQGRNLARQLLEQTPATNFTQNGIMKIRNKAGNTTNFFVSFQTVVTTEGWQTVYATKSEGENLYAVKVSHFLETNNVYEATFSFLNSHMSDESRITFYIGAIETDKEDKQFLKFPKVRLESSFANSDFWLADLGLEFFYWPEQKILKRENSRGRICKVLESTNPNPSTNGYSRVDSWIDEETLGIVEARAYDAQGKLLKEFYPKDVKKVDGQWQVETMEMDNVQTGSRSRIEFDLKK